MNRRGVALLTTLWVVVMLGVMVGAGLAAVRRFQWGATNRVLQRQGLWAARACLAIVEARWMSRELPPADTIDLGGVTRCAWQVDDPQARFDVNVHDTLGLRAALRHAGVHRDSAATFARALIARWDEGPIMDRVELQTLPGWDPRLAATFDVDGNGRVNAASAPIAVLASLPGISNATAARLVAARDRGAMSRSFGDVSDLVAMSEIAEFETAYRELRHRIVFDTTVLRVTTRGWSTARPWPRTTIERIVSIQPQRLAVHRQWIR